MATNDGINNSLADQTGTGKYVGDTSPTLVTPNIGAATGTSLDLGSTIAVVGTLDDDTFATATNTTLATSESIKAYVDSLTGSGVQIVQYAVSNSTTDDSSTSTSFVNSSLSGSITPTNASNIIAAIVYATGKVETTGIATTIRYVNLQIYRSSGTPAQITRALHGRDLVTGSATAAPSWFGQTIVGYETAGSTSSHTYVLRYSNGSGQNTASILASTFGTASMILLELKV